MFHLDSVALYGLHVVVGPYLHCRAPPTDLAPGAVAAGRRPSSPNEAPALGCSILSPEAGGRVEPANPSPHSAPDGRVRRLASHGDVLVPRSEFCRRVLWMYVAESGLLCLYYPEEIPGQQYPRQTLRYTLCFNFRIDKGLVTIGETLLRRLVQPYSVILTNVAAELRTAEVKSQYMFRQLFEEAHDPNARTTGTLPPSRSSATHHLTRNTFVAHVTPPRWTPLPELVLALHASLRATQTGRCTAPMLAHVGSAVRVSDRTVFHVRHVPPLQRVQPLSFEDTPVCVAAPAALGALDSCDLLVRLVLHLVDGRRTVADVCFGVAWNTRTTLAQVFQAACSSNGPVDVPLACLRHGGSNTRRAVRAAARRGSDGEPTNVVSRLPQSWPRVVDMVEEAILQLAANNVVKLLKPWRPTSIYSTTPAFRAVLADESHPARQEVGYFMACLGRQPAAAWRPRQLRFAIQAAAAAPSHETRTAHFTAYFTQPTPADGTGWEVVMTEATAAPPAEAAPGPRSGSWAWPLLREPEATEASWAADEPAGLSADAVRRAASAAVCCLGKFTGATPLGVRAEMRRLPVFSSFFRHWSLDCCAALVRVGLLNDWVTEELALDDKDRRSSTTSSSRPRSSLDAKKATTPYGYAFPSTLSLPFLFPSPSIFFWDCRSHGGSQGKGESSAEDHQQRIANTRILCAKQPRHGSTATRQEGRLTDQGGSGDRAAGPSLSFRFPVRIATDAHLSTEPYSGDDANPIQSDCSSSPPSSLSLSPPLSLLLLLHFHFSLLERSIGLSFNPNPSSPPSPRTASFNRCSWCSVFYIVATARPVSFLPPTPLGVALASGWLHGRFSTNSNVHHGMEDGLLGRLDGGDGVRLATTFDSDPFNAEMTFESITRAIDAIGEIGGGRTLVQWHTLIDPSNPDESALRLNAALSKLPDSREAAAAVAACMVTPAHLAILCRLEERFRREVRDVVLQESMELLGAAGDDPMPLCAEMLVEMARLNLVRLSGVVAVVESFLEKPPCRRAGLAVLGRMVDEQRGNERFLASVRGSHRIMLQLYNMHQQPEYEYDVVAITQLLTSAGSGGLKNTVVLYQGPVLHRPAPTTRIQYFGSRDELVSAHMDGTVALWGPPNLSGQVEARGTLDMPNDCIPWAMAGPRQGSFLVLSGKPLPPDSVYGHHLHMRKKVRGDHGAKTTSWNPVLRVLAYSESGEGGGVWTGGEVIPRPLSTTLSAVAALPNSIVCSAEAVSVDGGGKQHDIALFSAGTGQSVRAIQQAHNDYITVLATCPDSAALLLSGSRDRTVKLFDARAQPVRGGAAFQLQHHSDTISSIAVHNNHVFTTSLDGSLLVWDRRQISAPFSTRAFASPILTSTVLEHGESLVAVATARGLFMVSLPSMAAVDVIPNRAFTQVVANEDSSALFAADLEGIHVFALQKSTRDLTGHLLSLFDFLFDAEPNTDGQVIVC
eukprot:gene10194-7142_t